MNNDLKSFEELRRQWRAAELQELRDQAFVMKANLRFIAALVKEPESTLAPQSVVPPREGSFARKVYDQFNGVPRSSVDVARSLNLDSARVGFTTAQLHKRGYLRRVSPRHYTHAVAVVAAILCFAFSVCAQPALPTAVTPSNTFDAHLAWDKSPSVEAIGYRVYFGTNSAKLTSSVLAGNTTNIVVPALSAETVWYFAATAYDTNGFESDFSNQASLPLPAKTNIVITITMQTNSALTGWKQDIRLTPIVLTNPLQSSMFYRLTITSTNQ